MGRMYKSEAGWMMVGPKLFAMCTDDAGKVKPGCLLYVYMHEWGHAISSEMMRSGVLWDLIDRGAYGKKHVPTGQLIEAPSIYPEEAVAETYACLVLEPLFVRERWPEAAEAVAAVASTMHIPLSLSGEERQAIVDAVERSTSAPHKPTAVEQP